MIFFLVYSIIFFSLVVALLNNPINALFCLAACYFTSAFLLLILNLEFLALILIIIYIGALLMLFLFIIMLVNIKESPTSNQSTFLFKTFNFYIVSSLIFFISKFTGLTFLNGLQTVYSFEQAFIYHYLFKYNIDCFIFLYTDFFV